MSRIDLIYVSGGMLSRVHEVDIFPRGISDHAPMLCSFQTHMPPLERLWWLSRYWISDPIVEAEVSTHIKDFWLTNVGTAAFNSTWDTFKAYIRGSYQSSISRARQHASVALAEAKAQTLESRYVLSQNPLLLQGGLLWGDPKRLPRPDHFSHPHRHRVGTS